MPKSSASASSSAALPAPPLEISVPSISNRQTWSSRVSSPQAIGTWPSRSIDARHRSGSVASLLEVPHIARFALSSRPYAGLKHVILERREHDRDCQAETTQAAPAPRRLDTHGRQHGDHGRVARQGTLRFHAAGRPGSDHFGQIRRGPDVSRIRRNCSAASRLVDERPHAVPLPRPSRRPPVPRPGFRGLVPGVEAAERARKRHAHW